MNIKKLVLFMGGILLLPQIASAAFAGDLAIYAENVRFTKSEILEGQTVRIYTTVTSLSNQDLLGSVKFTDETDKKQIGSDQPVSIFAKKTDDVFVDWTPTTLGTHTITIQLAPWKPEIDDPGNNTIEKTVTVYADTDHDGIPNSRDPDDDNDGVPDTQDLFPLNSKESKDSDNDGIGDKADTDDDNDGTPDINDDLPTNPKETVDTDKDGIGNNEDTDDDNDGISDQEEVKKGLNPLSPDTDGDGINDKNDPFPLNPAENSDYDKDGVGDNADADDDNDGIADISDSFPKNKAPIAKFTPKYFVALNGPISFDASTSKDPDGEVKKYVWTFDKKDAREGQKVDFKFPSPGEHEVVLKITDSAGETASLTRTVYALNLFFFFQLFLFLILLLLALLIIFKYTLPAKKRLKRK